MFKIGCTEAGDPAFDYTFEDRLCEANIIITKNVCNIIPILLRNKEKCILHATITGFGGTNWEPNVPSYIEAFQNVQLLIDSGFPKEQIVLRLDPFIPTQVGFDRARMVIKHNYFTTQIKRLRFSYLDLYPHVIERFWKENSLASIEVAANNLNKVQFFKREFEQHLDTHKFCNFDSIEACAENIKYKAPCISKKDLEILNMTEKLQGSSNQRSACGCPANKVELLFNKTKCFHGCLYCYWKDSNDVDLLNMFLK